MYVQVLRYPETEAQRLLDCLACLKSLRLSLLRPKSGPSTQLQRCRTAAFGIRMVDLRKQESSWMRLRLLLGLLGLTHKSPLSLSGAKASALGWQLRQLQLIKAELMETQPKVAQ